jgi:hypothetical protein
VLLGWLAWVTLGSAFTWIATGVDPLMALQEMVMVGSVYLGDGYGPINALLTAGADWRLSILALASCGLLAGLVLSAKAGSADLLFHFGVAALVARLWTHHKVLDNVILVFLLLAAAVCVRRRPARRALIVFGLLCVSLWLPGRIVAYSGTLTTVAQVSHVAVWLAVGAYIVRETLPVRTERGRMSTPLFEPHVDESLGRAR